MTKCLGPLGALVVLSLIPSDAIPQEAESTQYLEHAHRALHCFWIYEIFILKGLELRSDGESDAPDKMVLRTMSADMNVLATSAGIALRNHFDMIGRPLDKKARDVIYELILEAQKNSVLEEISNNGWDIFSSENIRNCSDSSKYALSLVDAETRARN